MDLKDSKSPRGNEPNEWAQRACLKVEREDDPDAQFENSRATTHCSDDERLIKREVKQARKGASLRKQLNSNGGLICLLARALEAILAEGTGFLAIKEIISYSRLAAMLLPIQSAEEKIEAIRRAVERQGRTIQLSADRESVGPKLILSGPLAKRYDAQTVYFEGFPAESSEEVASFVQLHTRIAPLNVSLDAAGYGFMVLGSEEEAVDVVSRIRLGSIKSKSGRKRIKVMLKKDHVSQKAVCDELLREITALYETTNIFPDEQQLQSREHDCSPANPFARVLGLHERVSLLNVRHAIMHYEEPEEILQKEPREAIVRFKSHRHARLFLGKCSSLEIFGRSFPIEELKMDEASSLLEQASPPTTRPQTARGGGAGSTATSRLHSRIASRLASREGSRLGSRVTSRVGSRVGSRVATPFLSRAQSEDEGEGL